jgi:hypothetical protein
MKLRFRFLAALFALIGLLAISVEGVWAATCAAQMEAGSAAPSADRAAQAQSCSADAAAFRVNDADPAGGSDSDAPHCPSMPMGAAGACGAVLALPADLSPQFAPSLPESRLSPRTESLHELLLAGAFFRPPIA